MRIFTVMRRHLALSALALAACASVADRFPDPPAAPEAEAAIAEDGLLATVRTLAGPAYAGRKAGTPGADRAAEWIAARFGALGLEPAGDPGAGNGAGGGFLQTFEFRPPKLRGHGSPHDEPDPGEPAPLLRTANVVGILRAPKGAPGPRPREAVLLGAHYDHLGDGGPYSLRPAVKAVHPGADDNASGVAALLAAAGALVRAGPLRRDVVFAAFSAEEFGLFGSARYADRPAVPLPRTAAMVNLDMVGRLGTNRLAVYGTGTAPEWEPLLRRLAGPLGLELTTVPDGIGPSDQTTFYLRGVPVLQFFTGSHPQYHTPDDTADRIDGPGLRRISVMVSRLVRLLADAPGRPDFRKTREPSAKSGESGLGRAYFGTLPDYADPSDVPGVRLAAVTDGGPAAAAGLRAGDRIVSFAGEPVTDLQDYTDILRRRAPGDKVEIEVLRDGRRIALHAVLGDRADR